MNKKQIVLLIALITILLANSSPTSNELVGYWMAGAVNIGPNYYRPAYVNYLYNNNGEGQKYYLNKTEITNFTYEFGVEDSVSIDGGKNVKCFFMKPNVLKKGRFPFYYYKVKPSENEPTITSTQQHLLNMFWVNKNEALIFSKNGKIKHYNLEKGYEIYCYEMFEDEGMLFLQKKGNASFCEGQIRVLEKINSISKKELHITRWEEDRFQEIIYTAHTTLSSNFKREQTDFQLCNPYLNQHLAEDRYYASFSFYKGGLYAIDKVFKQQYQIPLDVKEETGRIRVLFVINCEGKIGRFSYTGLDENYKPKTFDPRITEQLVKIIKTLDDWSIGTYDHHGQIEPYKVDSYKFLTFKIRNGAIIEIFP